MMMPFSPHLSQLLVLFPLPEYLHAPEPLPLDAGPHLVAGHELLLVHLLVAEEDCGQQLVVCREIQIKLYNSVHPLEKTVSPLVVTAERHLCSRVSMFNVPWPGSELD